MDLSGKKTKQYFESELNPQFFEIENK